MLYDTMRLSVVQNPNGTYDLAVGLYEQDKRSFYQEYRKEFSTYREAKDYAHERAVAYQKTISFHELNIRVVCDREVSEYECPKSEKALSQSKDGLTLSTTSSSNSNRQKKEVSARISAKDKALMLPPGRNRTGLSRTRVAKSQSPAIWNQYAYVQDLPTNYYNLSWLGACMVAVWQNWWLKRRWTQKPSPFGNGTSRQIRKRSR